MKITNRLGLLVFLLGILACRAPALRALASASTSTSDPCASHCQAYDSAGGCLLPGTWCAEAFFARLYKWACLADTTCTAATHVDQTQNVVVYGTLSDTVVQTLRDRAQRFCCPIPLPTVTP